MNQTENTAPNSTETEERIRKVYVTALKPNAPVHTVFKALKAEPHTSRAGKKYLSMTLVDKTGALDARVFDNVDSAAASFAAGDYLLVKGTLGAFQGKKQLVIERLERLDPGPIDAAEFAYVEPAPAESAAATASPAPSSHKEARQRVLRLLDDPKIAAALDALLTAIDDRQRAGSGGGASTADSGASRRDRRQRGPRTEHKPSTAPAASEPPAAKRDPSLPEGLAFKPLTALVGD